MKKIILYIAAIFLIGVYIAGCNQLEDYESTEVLSKPTATLSVSAVADSGFVLAVSTDMAGYLGYAISSDTSRSLSEAISILSLSLSGGSGIVANQAFKFSAAKDTTINVKGLMPNTYYKVFAASNNLDGVESEILSFLLKTNDGTGPEFVSSSPAVSNEAAVPVGSDIVLTFNEPVKVNTDKKFIFTYYFENVTVEINPDESYASGNKITIPQPHEGHPGDYFFLSWEEGVVTDLSDNPCAERISGVIEGSLRGNYYRFEFLNFSVVKASVVPENDSVVADHSFIVDISFPFTIKLEKDLDPDMVKFRYTNWLGTVTTEVVAARNCEIVNDTTLRITQPHYPANGDRIALYLAEGVISDKYGNFNDLSEYQIKWTLGDFTIPEDIEPESGSVVTSQLFDIFIKFDFPISVVPDAPADVITMTYIDEDGSESINNVTDYFVHPENDSVLVIQTPQEISFGSNVILNIAENAVRDADGNVNLELQEKIYWMVPKLASGIDVLIGQYIVSGESYFDGSLVTDIVTIELNEDIPNSVLITGLFESMVGESEAVIGVYDPENSILTIDEQIIATGGGMIFTVFSDQTDDFAIRSYVLEDGSMQSDLALGVYDDSFDWLGYGEYLPEVTWEKSSNKSAYLKDKSAAGVKKINLKRISKRIK